MFNANSNKIFVLDTNVVLYDCRAMYSFEEHNVVIPITVLEEIDNFKRGNEIINFNAREFVREMDALSSEKIFADGVRLKSGGIIMIDTVTRMDAHLRDIFAEDRPDHRIISVAYRLQKEYGDRVTLVSKDINLRMKAKSIGIRSEDYETGKVPDLSELYKGRSTVEGVSEAVIDELYANGSVPKDRIPPQTPPLPNEYYIIRNGKKSALVRYDAKAATYIRVEKKKCYGIDPRNSEQTFAIDALTNPDVLLVTLSGKAGTGKTLMALAAAIEERGQFKQIFLARPIIPLSNRDLGFLPGDIKSKLDPFMQPLFDNLAVIKHQFKEDSEDLKRINDLVDKEKLVITPLAYIRGRSLSRIFFIIDEAQNLTPHEVKTIITRAGEGTKIVFTGDPYQIDTPYLDSRSNGLTYLIDKMKGQGVYAHVTLEKGERSYLSELASDLL